MNDRGGSDAAKRFEVATWEISFAQSKNAEQSSLEQSQEKAGICTRSHADCGLHRFLRTTPLLPLQW